MADPLPQDEPSDDFKAGWDKALAVAAFLVTPKPLPANPDPFDYLAFMNSNSIKAAITKLAGQYQFRHLKDV